MRNATNQPDFIIRGSPGQLQAGPAPGWRMGFLYDGPTALLDELTVHVGVLEGHLSPHPPHRHDHEELHFALSDRIAFVSGDGASQQAPIVMARGSVCFTDAHEAHTFLNVSADPASYLHMRWRRHAQAAPGEPRPRLYDPGPGRGIEDPAVFGKDALDRIIFSGPTRFAPRFTLKCVVLPRHSHIPLHRHDHEVAFAVVAGAVEVLGWKIESPGFALLGSRVPHGLSNPWPQPAVVYAAEFHGQA